MKISFSQNEDMVIAIFIIIFFKILKYITMKILKEIILLAFPGNNLNTENIIKPNRSEQQVDLHFCFSIF